LCDEFVVCPTSCGAVIAIDLATQSLAWAYQYPRTPQSLAARRYGAAIKLDQGDRWIDSTALVGENCVVVTPVESAEVHCLELSTGKLLWKQPRGEMVYAACIEQGCVVLVGKSEVKALRLADGAPNWPEALLLPVEAMPSGRGVSTGTHYYLPLTDGSIAQIELAGGVIAGQAKSLREIVPGNLGWHNGRFVSQGAAYLEVFDELAPLERRLKDALAHRPDDPAALARLGELELSRGRVAEAIDLLRRAHRASPSPNSRQRLTAALLEGVRVKLPEQGELNKELNQLAAP
jgi:hypothetical protein